MGKGSWRRKAQVPEEQTQENWDSVFGPRGLPTVMSDEDRAQFEREKAELEKLIEGPGADLTIPTDDLTK
jgi:hypothetical protein